MSDDLAIPQAPPNTPPPALACISCHYDLANLPLDSRCPECGTPIRCSAEPARLAGWETPRIASLHRALRWAWSLPISFIAVVPLICMATGAGTSSNPYAGLLVTGGGIGAVAGVLSTIVWSRILRSSDRPRFRAPVLRRLCVSAGLLFSLTMPAVAVGTVLDAHHPGSGGPILLLFCLAAASGPIHIAAALLGLEKLARTMGRTTYFRWALTAAICSAGPPIAVVAAIAYMAAMAASFASFDSPTPPSRGTQVVSSTACSALPIAAVASLIALISGGMLVARVRSVLAAALALRDKSDQT